MSDYLDNRSYSRRHLWAEADEENNCAYVGITEYLAEELGAIDCVDLPLPGDELDIDTLVIHFHINNRIHHIRTLLSGKVLEINKDVQDNPNLLHLDPYKNWIMKVEYDDPDEFDLLMDGRQYSRYLDEL